MGQQLEFDPNVLMTEEESKNVGKKSSPEKNVRAKEEEGERKDRGPQPKSKGRISER